MSEHREALRFDLSAFDSPVDPEVARSEGRAILREEGGRHGAAVLISSGWFKVIVFIGGVGMLAMLFVMVVQMMAGGYGANVWSVVIAVVMVTPLAIPNVRSVIRDRRMLEATWYRMSRFTAANGLAYDALQHTPAHAAALFEVGSGRTARDIVNGTSPREFEVAAYSFSTRSGRTRMPHTAAYVIFRLSAPLPPFTLRTRAKGLSPRQWKDPVMMGPVELGGEFDQLFDLRCRADDELAVRRLMTLDLREAFSDVAGRCDVEVVGDRIVFVARHGLVIDDATVWEWVEDLDRLVGVHIEHAIDARPYDVVDAERRRADRTTMLTSPRATGRDFVIGCLLPLLFGIGAAIASVALA